jgi:hypothetical protein
MLARNVGNKYEMEIYIFGYAINGYKKNIKMEKKYWNAP